jgi:hypothetical protein
LRARYGGTIFHGRVDVRPAAAGPRRGAVNQARRLLRLTGTPAASMRKVNSSTRGIV